MQTDKKMHGIWHCISWLHYVLIAKTWNCNVWEGKGANMTFTTANMNLINSTTRNIVLTLCILQGNPTGYFYQIMHIAEVFGDETVTWKVCTNSLIGRRSLFCRENKKPSSEGGHLSTQSSVPPESFWLQGEFSSQMGKQAKVSWRPLRAVLLLSKGR